MRNQSPYWDAFEAFIVQTQLQFARHSMVSVFVSVLAACIFRVTKFIFPEN